MKTTAFNITLPNEVWKLLQATAQANTRTPLQMLEYMIRNWDQMAVSASAPKRGRPAKDKEAEVPLPGSDGKLTIMQHNDPRTQRPGSKWLLTYPEHLPLTYMEAMPWAYRPLAKATRAKDGTVKTDGDAPPFPEFFVSPDDVTDLATPLRVYKKANVPTEHRATTPKAPTWVQHVWNEALGQWVPDAADFDACSFEAGSTLQYDRSTGETRWWRHQAYGASSVERLKELLTALEAEFSLTDDAKSFIGAKDAKNDVE